MRRFLTRLLLICLILGAIPSLYTSATDTTDELEQELAGLTSEAASLSEEIAIITKELENSSNRLLQTRQELAKTKGELEAQYEAMKTRIKYMYENGDYALLEILLSSGNMAIFVNKVSYFEAINEYDQYAINELLQTQENIEKQEADLLAEQERLTALQETLSEKESQLYGQIQVTSAELAEAQAQIAVARAQAEAAKQQAQQPVEPVRPSEPDNDGQIKDTPDIQQEDPIENVSEEDLILFAALIECEAGSSNYDGMLAVASVVVNRMKHRYFPDTLRGVIYQSGQFPPATNGFLDKIIKRGVKDSCLQVARDALAGKNNVGDCLSFRAASGGHAGTVIGGNVFF